MSIPSYLLLILLTAQVASAYTVVLTSGKRVEGTLISDQRTTIVIKDSQGVLISFKKSLLDLHAMTEANPPIGTAEVAPSKRVPPPSIVQLAAESKKRRTGKSKMLSLEDVDPTIPFSVLGSERASSVASAAPKSALPEREWQSRLWALKREVHRLRERAITIGFACEQSKQKQYSARTTPSNKPVGLMTTYRDTSQCQKNEEITSQLQEAETRLEFAREEARKAGVSWQTLE